MKDVRTYISTFLLRRVLLVSINEEKREIVNTAVIIRIMLFNLNCVGVLTSSLGASGKGSKDVSNGK
jgi:hypothetical protein